MPTPVGHALAGLAIGGALARREPLLGRGKDLVLSVVLAQLPDLDFVPGILVGQHDLYHHGPSHSLGMALAVGALAALWGWWRKDRPWAWGLLAFVNCFAHVLLDAAGMDTSYPYGVPLWWPFSPEYHILEHPIFWDVVRRPLGWPLFWHNLRAVGTEIMVLGPPALLGLWWNWRKGLKAAKV